MNETTTLFLGFVLPCLMTTIGASLIFFFNKTSKLINIITIGLASGIMLSASIWSLLLPALENAESTMGNLAFLPIVFGFLLGGIFMVLLDFLSSKIQKFDKNTQKNTKNRQKAFKLFSAITVHNIPEGLSVGFAIGTAISTNTSTTAAAMFAVGIALQNFPEGLATTLPIYNCLNSRKKAFFLATISGIVEPIFAILGYFLASMVKSLMPWLLSFAAGAMIYAIVNELLPETIQPETKYPFGTWSFFFGFVIMMLLDICL